MRRNHEGALVLSAMIDGHYVDHAYMYYTKKEAIKMFQEKYGTYPNDYTPLGVLTICNFGGLAIMEIEDGIDTYVYVTDNYGDGYKNLSKNKVYYDAKGNSYFVRNRVRYYLHDFMKV
jgi:hypothetical protein